LSEVKYWVSSLVCNFRNGLKYLSLSTFELPEAVTISPTNDATEFNAVLSVDNLSDNSTNTITGDGSLYFDYNGANLNAVIDTTVDAIDMSDIDAMNAGVFMTNVSLPDGAALASATIKVGTDSSNYVSMTSTTTHQGTVFQTGWNPISFLLADSTETGTVDWSSIAYSELMLTFTSTDPQTGIYVDGIFYSEGEYLEYLYYSKFLFINTNGAFQERVTSDTNIVNLDTDGFNMYVFLVGLYSSQQQQSANTQFDAGFFAQQYKESLAKYKAAYKGETQLPQSTYYQVQRGGYPYTSRRFKR